MPSLETLCGSPKKLLELLAAETHQRQEQRERAEATNASKPVYLDPVQYARRVLGIEFTPAQVQIVRSLEQWPYKTLVPSGHTVGKTCLSAALINHHFDTYQESSAIITIAPSRDSLKRVLWGEVRRQRQRAGLSGFRGDAVCELYDGPDHYAIGIATDKPEKITGHHLKYGLYIFDEGVNIKGFAWDAIRSMFQTRYGFHRWLVVGNPTDPTSRMYFENQLTGLDDRPVWNCISLSSFDHPNIECELRGRGEALHGRGYREPPLENAIHLETLETWIAELTDPLSLGDENLTDFQWPPEWWRREYTPEDRRRWFRPSGEFEARALGRWPSQSSGAVWSEAAWRAATAPLGEGREAAGYWKDPAGVWRFPGEVIGHGVCPWLPEIGCDPAAQGKNYTAICVRVGPHVMHFEQHNGWESPQTVGHLKELAQQWAAWLTARRPRNAAPITPQQIRVKLDSDGLGTAGFLQWADPGWQKEFCFLGISAASPPTDAMRYLNKRSELWFSTVDLAKMGQLDLSRLSKRDLQLLRLQAMAPQWKFDGCGHRVVEKKEDLVKRGVASPDALDSLNLCVHALGSIGMTIETAPAKGLPRPDAYEDRQDDGSGDDYAGEPQRVRMFRGR